jgi:predicted nucleotidyltransferase
VTTHPALSAYVDELVETLAGTVELKAAYLIGSVARGAYEHGRSDLDVYAVVDTALSAAEKEQLVERVEELQCPARALELVIYSIAEAASQSPRFELNLNLGKEEVAGAEESPHWFVLDRAIAENHAVPLVGPPWSEVFARVGREDVFEAIEQSLDWQESFDPLGRSALLNACRAWKWLEEGDWVSKPEAADWLRGKVRIALEEVR